MKPVKRIEIVVDAVYLPEVLKLLDAAGVPGYSVIRGVVGKGDRGERAGDELTDVFHNAYILCACPREAVPALVEQIRPVLKAYGGLCLVSEADSLSH